MDKLSFIGGKGKPNNVTAGEMCQRIKDVVYEYADQVPLALAIGVLHIAIKEILEES